MTVVHLAAVLPVDDFVQAIVLDPIVADAASVFSFDELVAVVVVVGLDAVVAVVVVAVVVVAVVVVAVVVVDGLAAVVVIVHYR